VSVVQEIILLATMSVIGVVLIVCNMAVSHIERVGQVVARDTAGGQAGGESLQAAKVLEAAELLLMEARRGAPARSAEASRDAASRPADAWVDETLWHALDEL
jgi:hypothetical protein